MHLPNPLYQGCNVGDLVISAITRGCERVAFISDDTRWTYRELGAKVSQVVRALAARGLRRGDAVATLSANRPEAFLINIARGDVVDEAALVSALHNRQIAGAGLDVYEFEPRVSPALMAMENVTLLPHLGTAALNVRQDMGMMAIDNLFAHLDGLPLPNPVA